MNIKIPKETENDKTFRLKDMGMPIYDSNKFGDLYVQTELTIPKNMNKEELSLIKKLSELRDKN